MNHYYTISSADLAAWLEGQPDRWWTVDNEFDLMSSICFPCPYDELVPYLRKDDKDLLVYDKTETGCGERITNISDLAFFLKQKMMFVLCWAGSEERWLLVEDDPLT